MADSSITAGPILDLIAGDCWARGQLRGGIGYVSVASDIMNPPTLLRVVFLQVPELDGGYLHDCWADSRSDSSSRGLSGSTPATLWYRINPEASISHWARRFRVEDEGVRRLLMT